MVSWDDSAVSEVGGFPIGLEAGNDVVCFRAFVSV